MPRRSSRGKEPASESVPSRSPRPRDLEPATAAQAEADLEYTLELSALAEDSQIVPPMQGQSSGRRRLGEEEGPAARPSNVPATTSSGLDGPPDPTDGHVPRLNRVTLAEMMSRKNLRPHQPRRSKCKEGRVARLKAGPPTLLRLLAAAATALVLHWRSRVGL